MKIYKPNSRKNKITKKKKKVKTKKPQKNKNVNFGNIVFAYEIQQCLSNKHIVTKLQLLQEFKVG